MSFITQLRDGIAELETERNELSAELDSLEDDNSRSAGEITERCDEIAFRAGDISALLEAKNELLAELEKIASDRAAHPTGPNFIRAAEPWSEQSWPVDVRSVSDVDIVRHAHAALEATDERDAAPKAGLEKVTEVLTAGAGTEPGRRARWAVATSNPSYERAFAKLVATRGHLEWSADEQAAYAAVADVSRAMPLTDSAGGFMVPCTLDPAINLTNDGSNSPLRRLATIKLTTTDSLERCYVRGAAPEWVAEAAQVADGSPTLAQTSTPTVLGDAFVPYSFELGMDPPICSPNSVRSLSISPRI